MSRVTYDWTLAGATFAKNRGRVFSCFSGGGGSTMGYKLAVLVRLVLVVVTSSGLLASVGVVTSSGCCVGVVVTSVAVAVTSSGSCAVLRALIRSKACASSVL